MADEITAEDVVTDALAPASISVDGQTATEHSIDQKIKAALFAAANKTASSTGAGFRGGRLIRCIPPGPAD